jgi:hypothetical protein
MEHQDAIATLAAERYLLGEMTTAEREAFESHFFDCLDCAADVRAGALMRGGVRAGLASAAPVQALRPAPVRAWRPAVVLPWAAAASLALLVGYQSLRPGAGGSIASGPLALAPATLRSATRGQEPVVTPGPGGIVTLAIDMGGSRFDGGVEHVLMRAADRTVISSGRADLPAPGAPLLLLVPPGLLKPGGHYAVLLRSPGTTALTGDEYRFSVGEP